MFEKRFTALFLITLSLFLATKSYAMNILQPYDSLIRPPYMYDENRRYHANIFAETGFATKSFNTDGTVSDPLHIWQAEQNALKMLEGFSPDSSIDQLRTRINANDDGVRGHFNVCSDFDLSLGAAIDARFFFLYEWFISVHMPFYRMKLKNVRFTDKTKDENDADCRVKNLLTNDFAANIKRLGDLDICDWTRTGAGDLTILLNWFRDFPQHKPLLKNARLNWRVGVSAPSGKREDEDLLLAAPFGADGSFTIPFGVGLDLMLSRYFQVGLDVQLTHIFGSTRDRRIKTHVDQTDLLLLQKAQAHKDFGLTQRFNLYFQFYKILRGFSFLVGYQFLKHGDDTLALCSNGFSQDIANSALHLKEWTLHHMIINASYDFGIHFPQESRVKPYLSLFARLPFNGKRATAHRTIGFVCGFDF